MYMCRSLNMNKVHKNLQDISCLLHLHEHCQRIDDGRAMGFCVVVIFLAKLAVGYIHKKNSGKHELDVCTLPTPS